MKEEASEDTVEQKGVRGLVAATTVIQTQRVVEERKTSRKQFEKSNKGKAVV